MCSILENDSQEMVRVTEKLITESDMCRKCQTNNAKIILRAKDLYCRPCFLVYFIHKFRSTIGKSKEIKPGDKLLMGLSGGLNSMALLHLTRHGLNEDTPKKLKFDPSVLFIDESVLQREGPSINIIGREIQKLNFPFYYTSFEEVFKSESSEMSITFYEENQSVTDAPDLANDDLRDKLRQLLFTHLNSQTLREDMICHLRNELICRCAKQLGFKKVFLGTNGTELSVRILTDIAMGRGSQLGDHVQFKARQFGVELFRPMRELLDDEVRHFVLCQNVFIPDEDSHSSNGESAPSIASCTKDFLSGLQREFVSTVPTVFKTGGKLVSGSFGSNDSVITETTASSSNSFKSFSSAAENYFCRSNAPNPERDDAIQREDFCLFCGLGKDRSYSAVSAAKSIRVSKALSTGKIFNKVANEAVAIRNSGNVDGALSANDIFETSGQRNNDLMEEETFKYFCYGCANLFLEVRNIDHFPSRVRERLKKRREQTTPELIQDCLM